MKLTLARKAGEGDRLFGSITAQDIADALAAQGQTVDKPEDRAGAPDQDARQLTASRSGCIADVHAELRVTVVAE